MFRAVLFSVLVMLFPCVSFADKPPSDVRPVCGSCDVFQQVQMPDGSATCLKRTKSEADQVITMNGERYFIPKGEMLCFGQSDSKGFRLYPSGEPAVPLER